MSIVNFKLEGELQAFVEDMRKKGYAASKTEVIRMALINLKEKEKKRISEVKTDI